VDKRVEVSTYHEEKGKELMARYEVVYPDDQQLALRIRAIFMIAK
jgi:hypothetical protein